jgi:hypothetical protein
MPERSYKIALRSAEEWQRLMDPKAPRLPTEKLRVNVDLGFKVDLNSVVSRSFSKGYELRRYAKDQREELEAAGRTWEEPSALFDRIMADFREELELALRDAMPWDDEL